VQPGLLPGESGLTHFAFTVGDTTPPTLSPSVWPEPVLLHGPVSVTPGATDDSGVASQSCGPVDTSTAGDHVVTCTATDNAGNSSSATIHYTVQYRILGFFSPVPGSKWKVGQSVPIKVALADANGVRIPDAEAAGLLAPTCRVKFSAEGVQTQATCMKYDVEAHQFVYVWKLGAATGAETIKVEVGYPGTTTLTTLSQAITITTK